MQELEGLREQVARSWLMVREPRMASVLRVQAAILEAIRQHLNARGFVECLPPIIGPVTDPGIRGAKQAAVDFYGREYRVMSSAILYKQMMASALGRMYFLSPNVRLEPPETLGTGRHLVEFVQADVEVAGASYHDAMRLAEELLVEVLKHVRHRCAEELERLGRGIRVPSLPFRRLSYDEALGVLRELGRAVEHGIEIPWEEERLLSAAFEEPFFIYDYPKGARGFYDREDPERPGLLRDFDLLYPGGYGEAASGAEREHEYARVVARIRNQGEDPQKYGWYLEMLRHGVPPSAGFGLGIERLTRYICGGPQEPIWRFRPYPKLPGLYSP